MEHFLTAAVLSFVGLLLGAVLQFLFTRHLEGKKSQRELRAKAYADYLACVSEHANATPNRQSPEGRTLATRTADAKCRICLYASTETVQAFAAFERLGASMSNPEQRQAFTKMVSLMRSDSSKAGEVALQDLQVVLLGKERDAT